MLKSIAKCGKMYWKILENYADYTTTKRILYLQHGLSR